MEKWHNMAEYAHMSSFAQRMLTTMFLTISSATKLAMPISSARTSSAVVTLSCRAVSNSSRNTLRGSLAD